MTNSSLKAKLNIVKIGILPMSLSLISLLSKKKKNIRLFQNNNPYFRSNFKLKIYFPKIQFNIFIRLYVYTQPSPLKT